MPLPLIAAGIAAIPSIFQGISGMSQVSRGKKLAASNIRPTYQRPDEVNQALALAQQNFANGVMPGTALATNNISASGATMLNEATKAAGSSGDILDAITKIDYNQGQQYNALAGQQAQYKAQQMQNLQAQLQNSAGYTDKEFAYNKDQPYQDKAAQASALIGAGNQNIGNAVNGIANIGTSLAMGGQQSQAGGQTGITNPIPSYLAPLPHRPTGGITSGAFRKAIYDPSTLSMKYV